MSKASLETHIGRRLRFRDLQVFFAVAECGGMAKAAAQLGLTQPAVSETIAGIESAFAVRLFDRSPHGVDLTIYGRALLKRGLAAFDELKQGIRDIEFLADPTVGEVRIGCPESIAGALLPTLVQQFSLEYPRTVLDVESHRSAHTSVQTIDTLHHEFADSHGWLGEKSGCRSCGSWFDGCMHQVAKLWIGGNWAHRGT